MADNYAIKDANGNSLTIRATDLGGLILATHFRLTDAAGNLMPAMDVVARKGFVSITDGANVMPTMDVAARAGFFKLTDGVNSMPTGDAHARKVFVLPSDGAAPLFGPAAAAADAVANPTIGLLQGLPSIFNGLTWDRRRTPNVFKSASAAGAGSTNVWTPTAGKKFRLMRYRIDVPADCIMAARGEQVIKLLDNATDLNLVTRLWLGQTAPVETASAIPSNFTTGWVDLGNGILSAVADQVLKVNLGTALSGGNIQVSVCGTEE